MIILAQTESLSFDQQIGKTDEKSNKNMDSFNYI